MPLISFSDGINTLKIPDYVYSSNKEYGIIYEKINPVDLPEWMKKPTKYLNAINEYGLRIVEEGFIQVQGIKETPLCKVEHEDVFCCYYNPDDETFWAYYRIMDGQFLDGIKTIDQVNLDRCVSGKYGIPPLREDVVEDIFKMPYKEFMNLKYGECEHFRSRLTAAELKKLVNYNGKFKNAVRKSRLEYVSWYNNKFTPESYPDMTVEHPFKLNMYGTGADDSYSMTYETLEDLRRHLNMLSEKPLTYKTVKENLIFTN